MVTGKTGKQRAIPGLGSRRSGKKRCHHIVAGSVHPQWHGYGIGVASDHDRIGVQHGLQIGTVFIPWQSCSGQMAEYFSSAFRGFWDPVDTFLAEMILPAHL